MSEHIQNLSDTEDFPSLIPPTRTNPIQTTPSAEYHIETPERWGDEERSGCPSSSASTTSSFLPAATIPPRLRTQETTPGAVCVPGLAGSFDDNQYDNLLSVEDEYDKENTNSNSNSIDMLSMLPTRESETSTARPSQSTSMTLYDQNTSNSMPIVAELSPSYLYSEQEFE